MALSQGGDQGHLNQAGVERVLRKAAECLVHSEKQASRTGSPVRHKTEVSAAHGEAVQMFLPRAREDDEGATRYLGVRGKTRSREGNLGATLHWQH